MILKFLREVTLNENNVPVAHERNNFYFQMVYIFIASKLACYCCLYKIQLFVSKTLIRGI